MENETIMATFFSKINYMRIFSYICFVLNVFKGNEEYKKT